MRIRITSDLHVDINRTNNFGFVNKLNEVDINIIAGDIAGSRLDEEKFFKSLPEHDNNIIAIAGNHLGYEFIKDSYAGTVPILGTKDSSIYDLRTNLSDKYLENEYIKIKDKVIFAGVMYSDFNLYGTKMNKWCKNEASRWMNDFYRVYISDNNNIRKITPDDYVKRFKKFKKELKKCLNETTEDIIVVSHFAPSKKSISPFYGHQGRGNMYEPGYLLNAAYASNLEKFIIQNPRIKLWIHGHMHGKFDYMIGQCRVVCEPYGYKHDTLLSPEEYEGKVIEFD